VKSGVFFPLLSLPSLEFDSHERNSKQKITFYWKYLFEWHPVKLQEEIYLFSYFSKRYIFPNANPSIP